MTPAIPTDIREYADSIARQYHPSKVILFGSHARGTAGQDSDVDLLVIMDHSKDRNVYAAIDIRSNLRAPFPMDLLVRRPEDIVRRQALGDQFINEILREGVVLYEGAHS